MYVRCAAVWHARHTVAVRPHRHTDTPTFVADRRDRAAPTRAGNGAASASASHVAHSLMSDACLQTVDDEILRAQRLDRNLIGELRTTDTVMPDAVAAAAAVACPSVAPQEMINDVCVHSVFLV